MHNIPDSTLLKLLVKSRLAGHSDIMSEVYRREVENTTRTEQGQQPGAASPLDTETQPFAIERYQSPHQIAILQPSGDPAALAAAFGQLRQQINGIVAEAQEHNLMTRQTADLVEVYVNWQVDGWAEQLGRFERGPRREEDTIVIQVDADGFVLQQPVAAQDGATAKAGPRTPRFRRRVVLLVATVALVVLISFAALIITQNMPPTASAQLVIEDFEGQPETTLIWWDTGERVYALAKSSQQVHSGKYSQQIAFLKTASFQFTAGRIIEPTRKNFSVYDSLVIWVYGKVDLLVKLEDARGTQIDLSTQTSTSRDTWTRLVYRFDQLAEVLDLTAIEQIFLFMAPNNSKASGTVFVDDMLLIRSK